MEKYKHQQEWQHRKVRGSRINRRHRTPRIHPTIKIVPVYLNTAENLNAGVKWPREYDGGLRFWYDVTTVSKCTKTACSGQLRGIQKVTLLLLTPNSEKSPAQFKNGCLAVVQDYKLCFELARKKWVHYVYWPPIWLRTTTWKIQNNQKLTICTQTNYT